MRCYSAPIVRLTTEDKSWRCYEIVVYLVGS